MRFNPVPLLTLLILSSFSLQAQDDSRYHLLLKSGYVIPEKNITDTQLETFNRNATKFAGKSFAVIQFDKLPGASEKQLLSEAGITLLDYVPGNAYTVTISGTVKKELLLMANARAIIELSAEQKMQTELANKKYPVHAIKVAGTVDVLISFPRSFQYETVLSELQKRGIEIISGVLKEYRIITLRISQQRLMELASYPFIEYVQAVPEEEKTLNNISRANSKAHAVGASVGLGRNLKGEGITIGIGDNADPQHVDLSGRIINRTNGFYNYHGTHVHGIAGGAGIWNELYTGHAPKARIISQLFSGIIKNAPAYVADFGMVLTNNSWANIAGDCSYNGLYDFYSGILDQQAFNLPKLQHVFAAGNSGNSSCSPYPAKFKTVLGSHQSSKNVLTVGNTMADGTIFSGSSRGPVKDGRIKPEIVAQGTAVWSTANFVDYWPNTGTSMASPSVAGGLALLYQRYKQLNASVDPPNGLMKAIVCNAADDRGNPGPDYTYGFGGLNLLRAVQTIENNRFFSGALATGGSNTHTITVPANTATLKVLLYWNDPAAAPVTAKALVNDLNLTVSTVTPSTLYLPLVLDITPSNVNANAVPGIDTVNNIEQVTISNPAAGSYDINVNGYSVPVNAPQSYFLAYDLVPVSTTLTYPVGGEKLLPGEVVTIMWDSYGIPAETFNAEYSLNNGTSWNTIDANINSTMRQINWTVPAGAATNQALVRIAKNNTAQVSTSAVFTIIGAPSLLLADVSNQCEGYINLSWTTVPNATQYEVMKLKGDEMVSEAIVPNTVFNYTFSGLSKDSVYWVTVRAIYNGSPGRRDTAVFRQPNTGSCGGGISDNDIKLETIISPASSGRQLTSTALSSAADLTVRVKNLDDAVSNATLTFSYSVNGGLTISDPPITPSINPGNFYDYTFVAPINLSATGTYNIEVSVTSTGGDPVTANNKLTKVFKQIDNPSLSLPFADNIETADEQTIKEKQMGLQGLDRYDFVNTSTNGRLRTFINSGMSYSGTRAITLDADKYNAGNTDSLTGTFNLPSGSFNANTDDIRLDFRFKNHGQSSNAANKVWVRGTDLDNWIEVYDLGANQNEADGSYKLSSSIQVSDFLKNAIPVQNYSSSFQVRWGQYGLFSAADNEGYAGYTFDDIRLYKVIDDLQLMSIDAPVENSCNLGTAVPVIITVKNNSETAIPSSPGIPVRYRLNNGAWVNETITAGIAANTSYQYTFSNTADLSAINSYLLEAEVLYLSDTYKENDTLSKTIVNTPTITVTNSSPYLQDFELNNGYWYAAGKNSSWEFGTPASYKINRAASGTKAWKTGKAANYKDNERSYLYSPCFDISTLSNPAISFSLALDLEDCGAGLCDGAYLEYSVNGTVWQRLGANGQGTNWYNKSYTGNNLWSVENYHRWHVATLPLTVLPAPLSQYSRIQFRYAVSSDAYVNREGIAIDDIHIYNNPNGIYDGLTMGSAVTANIPGATGWVDFISAGKLVASVNSPVQSMGNTDVQAYINTGAVRTNSGQYYHDRNITIKPAAIDLGSDSATIRFYFLDSETEALLNATGCAGCYKPSMAYELGVSKYSDPNDLYEDGVVENGLVANGWKFINNSKIRMVPFDKGYYAEFKVKDFSEFWLNNGGFDSNHPLPVQLISFTAQKIDGSTDVITKWKTASELNVSRFEIEVARGNNDFQLNRYSRIGQISSLGNAATEQQYSFIDQEAFKTGIRYYRLKMIDIDGSYKYSAIRPVVFKDEIKWQVTPNPSSGIFNLVYQGAAGEIISLKVYDANGKMVKQQQVTASGFVEKLNIGLNSNQFAMGLYHLEVTSGKGKQTFKLVKQ